MTEGSKTRNKLLVTSEPCYQIGGNKTVSRHTQPFGNGARGYLERRSPVSTNLTNLHPNHFTDRPIRDLPPPLQKKASSEKVKGIQLVSQNELHLHHRSCSNPELRIRSQHPNRSTKSTETESLAATRPPNRVITSAAAHKRTVTTPTALGNFSIYQGNHK